MRSLPFSLLLPSRLARAASLGLLASTLPACTFDSPAPQREEPAKTTTLAPQSRPASTAPGAETWNAAQIEWLPFEAGLERAKSLKKPICLVIYTTWCPHCKNYSRVFDDPRVVERARDFVMIRIDADKEPEFANLYVKDGGYIPRTFFLLPDGTPDFNITAGRDKFRYFYNEQNPAGLLGGMADALLKLQK
jgi:hypothetical protein